jgi:hypothetical protein
MKKMVKVGLVIGLVTMSGSAWAEPVSLTLTQVINVTGALSALDGHDQVVKEGGAEKVVKVSYTLSGAVRLAIARDLTKLKAVIADFQAARAGKIVELSEGGSIKPGSEVEQKLGRELTVMLEQKQNLDLTKLSVADLGLLLPTTGSSTPNPIPPTVLSDLGPILAEEQGK